MASDLTLREWRPSLSRYLGFARVGMVVVGVVAVVETGLMLFVRTAGLAALSVSVVIVVTGTIALGSQLVRIWRTRLSVDQDWVYWRGVFARSQLRRSVVRGVLAPIKQPMMVPTTMLLLTDGSQRVRLVAGLWAESDLSGIAAALQLDSPFESLSQIQVEAQVPGATTALGRHPWRTGLLAALVIFLAAAVGSVLLVLLYHPNEEPRRGPARVSQQTVVSQTRELGQLEGVFGARGWPKAPATLWTCDDDSGAHGWQRHVESINTTPDGTPESSLGRAESVLRADGYDLSDPERASDRVVLDGERDTGADAATVEVLIDAQDVSIDLTGACEI